MAKVIKEPETGNEPGLYEAENTLGEKVTMVAQNFPQADALKRQGWTFVKSLSEVQAEQAAEMKAKMEAVSDKKGK